MGLLCLLGMAGPARAQEAPGLPRYSLSVSGVPLDAALRQFLARTRVGLVYTRDQVAGKTATCTASDVTTDRLLTCLLDGTGLTYRVLPTGTFALVEAASPAGRTGSTPSSQPVHAPQAGIRGVVLDAATHEPLANAHVVVDGTAATVTDTAGRFALTRLPPGRHTVRASYIGYMPAVYELALASGEQHEVDLLLRLRDVSMDEVVVQSDAEEENAGPGAAQMEAQEAATLPAVLQADVFRALHGMAGIQQVSDVSSDLYIRGGSPDQTLVLLDGTPVYQPGHFFGLFSAFNPDAVETVQVYKGTYPATYGGRIGSVVDIDSRAGSRDSLAGRVSLGLLSSKAMLERPMPHGSWLVTARRSALEPTMSYVDDLPGNVPERFYFYDVHTRLGVQVSAHDRLALTLYGGADHLSETLAANGRIDLVYGNRTGSLTWTRLLSPQAYIEVMASTSRYQNRPDVRLGGTAVSMRNEIEDVRTQADLMWMPGRRHDVQLGLGMGTFTTRYARTVTGLGEVETRQHSLFGSLYVQDTWRPRAAWQVEAGLHANAFERGRYFRIDPRLSIAYAASDDVRLEAAYGRYHQFLVRSTQATLMAFDSWLPAGDGVKPAWGDQFGLGLDVVPRPHVHLNAELYFRTMRDLAEPDPDVVDDAGLAYRALFRVGTGRAWGVELTGEKQYGRFRGSLGYTYAHTRRRFPGFNDGRPYPPAFDRTHDLQVTLTYALGRHWRATARFGVASGQPYTRPLGRMRFDDPTGTLPIDVPLVGRAFASHLPAYHRLDLAAVRHGSLFGWADYELQLQVVNVYNRRNVWYRTYDYSVNPVETANLYMLPVLPSVTLTVAF